MSLIPITPAEVARAAWQQVRSSAWLTRRLFGVEAQQRITDDLWDTTSLMLREAIRRYVKRGHQVLDLGTGHVALLGIYCAKERGARVTAVDISQLFLDNAIKIARASAAPPIKFIRSNWFDNVGDQLFDVIFVNCPYFRSEVGERIGATPEYRQIWDGGEDGCEQVRNVLRDTPAHLAPNGRLLLGINTMYLPRSQTLALILAAPGLGLEAIVGVPWYPGEVYVAKRLS